MRPAAHPTRTLALAFAFVVVAAPVLRAQDLSVYRQFHLGMTAMAVTAQLGVPETAAKIIHTRPLLLQELEWRSPGTDWTDTELVVARWADERVSVNLFHT